MTRMPDLAGFQPDESSEGVAPTAISLTGLHPLQIQPGDEKDSNTVIPWLNERFRVIAEGGTDPRQWLLQRSKVVKGRELWESISFCVTRDGLLLAIRDKCIPVEMFKDRHEYPGLDAEAIAIIKALPDRFTRRA